MLMHAPQGGLFAAALTPLIIDSKQSLKADPTDRIVYYLEQHSTILHQISQQISHIAPEVSIPSTPPHPPPPFAPSSSDVALNTLWFIALVYGIFGALVATLVQKWIRRCLRNPQRRNNPTTRARFWQLVFEQLNKPWIFWITEFASSILYASLFCFFVGLCIYTWDLNPAVASITTVYSSTCVSLYFFFGNSVFSDIPFVSSYWQKMTGILFKLKLWSGKGQDEQAIRWLIDNLEEDAEMESFMLAIPGSFNTGWGAGVWKKISEDESESRTPATTSTPVLVPTIHPHPSNTHPLSATTRSQGVEVPKLYAHVSHLLDTCKDSSLFEKFEERRRRMRGCIEAIALLVCCANAKIDRFGDIVKLLGDTGNAEKTRDLSSVETDGPFVMRWTCLSLLVIRSILERSVSVREKAKLAVETLAGEDDTGDDRALAGAQNIDGTLQNARSSLLQLNDALARPGVEAEQVTSTLRHFEPQLSQLENIRNDVDLSRVDQQMFDVQSFIITNSHGIARQLPGVQFDDLNSETGPVPVQSSGLVERSDEHPRQFMFPGQTLGSICSLGPTFRAALEGVWDADARRELLENVKELLQVLAWKEDTLRRQLWRLQDLRDGGGLGFTVELYFLALKQLLSIPSSSSNKSHSLLYIGAFRAITSDWAKYKHSLGTQKLLLDMVLPSRGIMSEFCYPTDVTDEFLGLLGNILKGQGGSHIDDVMQVLSAQEIYYASYEDE